MVGTKVSITSPRPNTTRPASAASCTGPTPRSSSSTPPGSTGPAPPLGERLNETAAGSLDDVDVVVAVVDATARGRSGRPMVLAQGRSPRSACGSDPRRRCWWSVNKIDRAGPAQILARLAEAPRPSERLAAERARRRRAGAGRVLPGLRHDRRRGRRRSSRPSWPGCPRARAYYPDDMVHRRCPRRSGWPSSSASSCCAGSATSCPTPSPAG